jgi:voltage-dependent calcium channel N type alpha-1B
VFVLIFTIESLLKITASGFIIGSNSYLRSGWNILDFTIVVAGVLEFSLDFLSIEGINLRALRTLRVLRPLKGLKTIPSLRKQVSALI